MRIKHHISGLYKKILTPIWVRFFFLISFAVVYASSLTTAQWKIITQIFNSWYAIDKNIAATSVYWGSAGAVCKKVTNTCTPGDGIFVPTKYDSEWQGNNWFINKYPSCTVVATCWWCSSNSDCSTNQICTGHVAATTTYNTRGFTWSFVSVGTTNTCALSQWWTVKCWGANSNWELWIWVTWANTNLPSQVVWITTAIQVSVWNVHACVLLAWGTIQCWGYNWNWALWNGSNTSSNISVQVSWITNAIQISAGSSSSCALLNDWTVKCWGYNTYGQLWNGSNTTSSNIPVQVSWITNAFQISAGSLSSCALLNDWTIKCWWDNTYGQLWNGTIISSNIPVQVSNLTWVIQVSAWQDGHTCALLNDWTVKCWGFDWRSIWTQYNNTIKLPVLVSGLTGVIQISAGSPFSCALLTGGISKCWGDNTFWQLWNWNTNSSSVPVQVSTLTGVIQISAGSSSACALLSWSIVKCWGTNQYWELWDGTFAQSKLIPWPVSNLSTPVPSLFSIIPEVPGQCVAVPTWCKVNADCSTNQTCSGYVASQSEITWYPAISQWIVSSEQYKSCILSGWTVRCWGNGLWTTPIKVSNLDNVLGVYSSDYRFSCALKTDWTVWCWGIGNNWELGNWTLSTSSVPVKVSNLSGVSVLAVGSQHSCVLKTDWTVWCWWRNSYGELWIAPSTYSTVPVQNINIANVKSLALGYNHSCALLNNWTVKCWWDNEYWLLWNNSTTNSSLPLQVYNLTWVTSIQSRWYTSCALKTDWTVWCWWNGIYQAPSWFPSATNIKPTLRPNLSNVNTFFLWVNNACAILSDSTVKCWWGNDYGQLWGWNLNGLTDVTTLALWQVNIYALHQNWTLSS